MNARRTAKPIVGLVVFAGIALLGYVAFEFARPMLSPFLIGFTRSHLDDAIPGQRILSLRLAGDISPPDPATEAAGTLAATADLTVEVLESPRSELVFFLNPGLSISAATLNGEPVRSRRDGTLVTLKSRAPLPPDAPIAVHVEYRGALTDDGYVPAAIRSDRAILPHLSFWHPLDLNSFFPVECSMEIPGDWMPALNGATESSDGSRKRVVWKDERPALGATFIAGPYEGAIRMHGAIRCDLFWEKGSATDPEPILGDLGGAYSYLRVLYGSDGFDRACVVVDPNIQSPFNGGNSVIGLPAALPDDPRDRFALLARNVAYNWWGNTVTGRWFTQQPEATSWLVHGFAEYSAWQALRGVKGKADQLRYLETLRCPPSINFPMKAICLPDAYKTPSPMTSSDPAYIFVRQPFTLSVFAAQAGEDRFLDACKNILRIHRYRSVSYMAVLQELELASETDLRETFRVWFERSGTFDYAVEDVSQDAESVRVTISNPGDIPAFGELQVALVSAAGTVLHPVEPGAHGGSFVLPTDSPVETVILDPEYQYPDMRRDNNVWPRRVGADSSVGARQILKQSNGN